MGWFKLRILALCYQFVQTVVSKPECHNFNQPIETELINIERGKMYLIEEDMLVRGEQLLRNAGKFRYDNSIAWQMPIRYKFCENAIGEIDFQTKLRMKMDMIQNNTCVKFEEYKGDTVFNGPVLSIRIATIYACAATVGLQRSADNYISMAHNCLNSYTSIHELLHVLGFGHEHSRSIRNNYVTILEQSVREGFIDQFSIDNAFLRDQTPYDYGSVMHYSTTAFRNKPDAITILPKDINYLHVPGQRSQVTFNDWKKVNMAYCSTKCPKLLNCTNQGYTDPTRCSVCKCPTGFNGDFCEKRDVCDRRCNSEGKSFTVTGVRQTVTINANKNCIWHLQAEDSSKKIYFDVRMNPKSDCNGAHSCLYRSYLEIRFRKDLTVTGARYCCGKRFKIQTETENAMLIVTKHMEGANSYIVTLYAK